MAGLSRPSMASEALGLLPGEMPEMQERFLAAMDGGHAENAGSNSRPADAMDDGLSWPSLTFAGPSRPSMASGALGLLPGGHAGNAGAISGARSVDLRIGASTR